MPDPIIKAYAGSYYCTEGPCVWAFDKVADHRDGMTAEITATIGEGETAGQEYWGKVNLVSTISRRDYTKGLQALLGSELPLNGLVDRVCHRVVITHRRGDPARPLIAEPAGPDSWFLDKWIPRHETSVIYGDGGSGKSLLALTLSIASLTGQPIGRSDQWQVAPVTAALYLDWESNYRTHAARLHQLYRLHGTGETVPNLYYLRMLRPLSESISMIAKEVATHHIQLVWVDSLAAASGPEPEFADAAIRTLNALATLDSTTRVVIAHVAKTMIQIKTGAPPPFGSVFVRNLARSAIYCELAEQSIEDEMTVTYYHNKINDGSKQAPRALSYTFDGEHIAVSVSEPDLTKGGLSTRILDLLRHGPRSVTVIAEELTAGMASVRTTLNRLEKHNRVLRLDSGGRGKGDKTLWGLAVTKRYVSSETS